MKFRFLVFFLLASSSIAFGQGKGGSNKEYKNSLKAAKEHLRYEEFQQALPYVQELLKEDANSAYYNFWMGKCLYITYKKNQALPSLSVADAIDVGRPARPRPFRRRIVGRIPRAAGHHPASPPWAQRAHRLRVPHRA